jgi:pimeloyl-ACP methyl ester carboxylesterase
MPPLWVIMLPGSVLPAELAYGSLVAALALDADIVAKELEVYATQAPPPDYTLDLEVRGVLRDADAHGWERFHLVGYSGGGAAALAVAAHEPARVSSLAVLEPAWAGRWDRSPAEEALWVAYDEAEALSTEEFMRAFMRLNVRSGVELPAPPPGDPPPWMAKRPGGIHALMQTFRTYDLDREALARFPGPVYFALGGLSNPDQFGEIASRLATVFSDFELEVFDERHHFDPPHRSNPSVSRTRSELSGAGRVASPRPRLRRARRHRASPSGAWPSWRAEPVPGPGRSAARPCPPG